MGYSVETMGLLQMMHGGGLFSDIKRVVDIGSQEIHFATRDTSSYPYREIIRTTISALGGPQITDEELSSLSNRASAGDFFKYVGLEYKSIDADGWYGEPFDLNLDDVREEDRGSFCLCINGGTTEHLIDQSNAFRVIHDLTRPGGLMVHTVPFLASVDHGFFNYNPNFFWALARFNSYEVLGLWVQPVGCASLIPWNDDLKKFLRMPDNLSDSIAMYCLLRKIHDTEFCIPFQSDYEEAQDPGNLARYNYSVDGRLMSGIDVYRITQNQQSLDTVSGRALLGQLLRRLKRRMGLNT